MQQPSQEQINCDFDRRITALERQSNGTGTAEERHKYGTPWYKSIGAWLALFLAILMLYCIYLLWQKSTGHIINIFGLIRF
jgi:hypothetical protein